MSKYLIALAIAGAMIAPVAAQSQAQGQQAGPDVSQTQPAKPQTVKKRICEQTDEDPSSRLGGRKICRTVEVPVQQDATNQQAPASNASGK
jgi:hypothetical protein